MDSDEQSLNSAPTIGPGGVPQGRAGRPDEPYDEPSLGSAPTMVGQGVPGTSLGQIDQYQLVRKLGGGGFGVVYLARDTVSGIDVALKTLHPLLKSNPEEKEALRAKFALVSRLSHPNIASALVLHPCRDIAITDDVALRELRLSPGDFIMVMRYASGVTLSKWRRQFPDGVVPLDQALEVVRQVASALDYAHGERIVHRDIKPANVMVETLDGGGIRARILDFGLAAEIRSSMSRVSSETGDTSGTRPYMAPEQWLGRKQDGRTDQYALACVAYELLSGAPPFAGVFETGDPTIMVNAVQTQTPDEIDGVSPAVNGALLKALAKNPKDRFGSCGEFVEAISHAEARENTNRLACEEVEAERKERKAAKREANKKALGKALLAVVPLVAIGVGIKSCGSAMTDSSLAAAVLRNHERGKVQLWAGGPYWAETNIGADKPEDYGLYFWWGDTVGYRREGNAWVASDDSSRNFSFDKRNTPTYDNGKDGATLQREEWTTSAGVLAPAHDAAHVHWGGKWRMPTKQELDDLISKCDWTWTTMNGVDGYVVTGRGAYAGASIFLPAAGDGDGTSLDDAGSRGYYWSSNPSPTNGIYSWRLYFYSGRHDVHGGYLDCCRYCGRPVRPVQGFAE